MKPHKNKPSRYDHLPLGIKLLYEDQDLLVVDKPTGLLTMGTEKEKERTLYWFLTDYVRKGNAKSSKRIFIVHRLDREASGLLVFAKSEAVKFYLQDHWEEAEKNYVAVVHGCPTQRAGTITSYLAENAAYKVYSTSDRTKGKLSRTKYQVLRETKDFSLLGIELLTGRKHQIRVHLADSGHPIVGDERYGEKDRIHKRMALHAVSLAFKHPRDKQAMFFQSEIPSYFTRLTSRQDEPVPAHEDSAVDRRPPLRPHSPGRGRPGARPTPAAPRAHRATAPSARSCRR